MHRTRRCLSETPAPNEPRVSVQRLRPAAASGGNQSSPRCVRTTQHCRVGERRQQAVAPITVLPLRPAAMRKCWTTSSSLAQRTRTSGTRSCSSRSCFVPVTAQNRSAEPPFQGARDYSSGRRRARQKPAREFRFVAGVVVTSRVLLRAFRGPKRKLRPHRPHPSRQPRLRGWGRLARVSSARRCSRRDLDRRSKG
jgi:hypothetical protein